jgi:citrate synthase
VHPHSGFEQATIDLGFASLTLRFERIATFRQEEPKMSDEHAKTPADHIGNTVAQLKEMRHYSKNNVETLTAEWLLFDGELSKLKLADKIADLMDRQGQLHEALENAITDLEEVLEKMKPEPEAEA